MESKNISLEIDTAEVISNTIKSKDLTIFNMSLKCGMDVNIALKEITLLCSRQSIKPKTLLKKIVFEMLELLVEAGGDISNCSSLFINAIVADRTKLVEYFIKSEIPLNMHEGEVPLLIAVEYNHFKTAKLLIDAGANVNSDSLKLAALCGYTEIFKLLVNSGADIKQLEPEVLLKVTLNCYSDIVELIAKAGVTLKRMPKKDYELFLYDLINKRNIEEVKLLIVAGVNVSIDDNEPLILATRLDCPDMVELLLSNGASAKARNSLALSLACRNRNYRIIKLLLDNGADASADNSQSLIDAIYSSDQFTSLDTNDYIERLLINSGAKADAQNSASLKYAMLLGRVSTIDLLLSHGARASDVLSNYLFDYVYKKADCESLTINDFRDAKIRQNYRKIYDRFFLFNPSFK